MQLPTARQCFTLFLASLGVLWFGVVRFFLGLCFVFAFGLTLRDAEMSQFSLLCNRTAGVQNYQNDRFAFGYVRDNSLFLTPSQVSAGNLHVDFGC